MPAPATEDDLYAALEALGIQYATTRHRPVFTVEEGADLKAAMPGGHTKNLFLKDKKGALFLLSALSETKVDLNALSKALGAGRFSFGAADLLLAHLGVTPGSVTAFAVINDKAANVRMLLDEAVLSHDLVNFHPLRNDATTAIKPSDLLRFLETAGHAPTRVAFGVDGAPHLIDPSGPPAHVMGRNQGTTE